jgi:hypothetical protein
VNGRALAAASPDPWKALEEAVRLPRDVMRVLGSHPEVGVRICYAFRNSNRQPLCGSFDIGLLKKDDNETPICQRCLRRPVCGTSGSRRWLGRVTWERHATRASEPA